MCRRKVTYCYDHMKTRPYTVKKVHLQESRKDDHDSSVSQHFNTDSHSITDMTIAGLCYAPLDIFSFSFHFKIIYPGYNSVHILFYNWPYKSYLQNKELYNTKFTIKIKK